MCLAYVSRYRAMAWQGFKFSTVLVFAIAASLLPRQAFSYNVLAVLPIPIYSHTQPFMPVIRALAEKGHNVTLITPLQQDNLPDSLTHLKPNYTYQQFSDFLAETGFNRRELKGTKFAFKYFWDFCVPMSELMAEVAKDYLPPPKTSKFDLIIIEPFLCEEALVALGHIYNAPVVGKHPGPVGPIAANMMGNPNAFSYVPSQRLPYSDRMDFWQRLLNFIVGQFELLFYHVKALPGHDRAMRKVFNEYPDLPYIGDMLSNISLMMTETHYSVNYPRPYARNILEIGGVGVNVIEPIPQDVKEFIDGARHGIIYMSWGSHFHADDMFPTIAGLMLTFGMLRQRVLLRWPEPNLSVIPKNVMVKDWFPQTAILAHPKLKLYICHGGINSIYEAAYHGVPVLGIPISTDQPHNIAILQELGMASHVEVESVWHESPILYNAINRVMDTKSYIENAQKRSEMLKNRPMEILEETTFWLEHIMHHRGGTHLRPAASWLPWYARAELDVIGFIILSITGTIIFTILLIIRLCEKPPPPVQEKKKKKQ